MGIDIMADLIIGYPIDLSQFEVVIPEKFHMEERFSEKTGKKLKEKTKVVDEEERTIFRFGNIEEDFPHEFAAEFEVEFGVCLSGHGDWEDLGWYVSVPIDATSVQELQNGIDEVEKFKKTVKDLGIEVEDFEVDIKISTSS